jgi:hypothetical protein
MIPQIEVDAFWAATVECLVRFHGCTESRARAGVAAFRDRVSRAPVSRPDEMVYHDEPFNVACSIAGRELDQSGVMEEYDRILDDTFERAASELAGRDSE